MATKGKSSERLQMTGTVHKAYKVLLKLINPKFTSKDKGIPLEVIKNAKGLAFVTQIKAGFVFTGTVGAGIIIARLADGSWSGPTSVGVGGMGWGLQSKLRWSSVLGCLGRPWGGLGGPRMCRLCRVGNIQVGLTRDTRLTRH